MVSLLYDVGVIDVFFLFINGESPMTNALGYNGTPLMDRTQTCVWVQESTILIRWFS
jgi:hypothetical protein